MSFWKLSVLHYGNITSPKSSMTPGIDADITVKSPYLGFLLQKDGENVLVDTGINESFIIDGKAWGGWPAEGGTSWVLNALKKHGLEPRDIDMVIYTHLHNDHAGACAYFPHANTVFQKDEWANLLSPLPSQLVRRDYDMDIIEVLRKFKDITMVEGDVELYNGIRLLKTPGHTKGSQSVLVQTEEGPRIIVGDLFHWTFVIDPQSTELVIDDKGTLAKITPLPQTIGPIYAHSLVYDQYAYYDSYYKIKAALPKFDKEFIMLGHDAGALQR